MARVTIFNLPDDDINLGRLSNSVVSLLNYQGGSLKTYRIEDALNMPVFDINFAGEIGVLITNAPTPAPTNTPTRIPTFDATLIWRVRVQLEGRNFLHIREVEVYDQNGVNRALNKPASQSSTYTYDYNGKTVTVDASYAVDGNWETNSHTNADNGK